MDYIYDSQSMYHHPTSLYPAQSGFAPSPSAFASFYLNSGHYPSSGYFGQMSPSSPACYEGNSSQNNSLNSSQANKLPIMTNQVINIQLIYLTIHKVFCWNIINVYFYKNVNSVRMKKIKVFQVLNKFHGPQPRSTVF